MSDSKSAILSHDWGVVDYQLAYAQQLALHDTVVQGSRLGHVIQVQHPPTITFGKYGKEEHLLLSREELSRRGVECVRSDRGGEVTAHMPGQLVIYPILHLSKLGLGARAYVDLLVNTSIKTLREWGVEAHPDPQYPGVWVQKNKICAIGVRIKARVSLHGIALNVNNDLELFRNMVPCGIRQRSVISLQQLTGEAHDLASVGKKWLENFASLVGHPIGVQN